MQDITIKSEHGGPATIQEIRNALSIINKRSTRSAWDKGVAEYARELLDELQENAEEIQAQHPGEVVKVETLNKALLNGAENWAAYSYGGCSLIFNGDILERLAPPSVRKRSMYVLNGEDIMMAQARALEQAAHRIIQAYRAAYGFCYAI